MNQLTNEFCEHTNSSQYVCCLNKECTLKRIICHNCSIAHIKHLQEIIPIEEVAEQVEAQQLIIEMKKEKETITQILGEITGAFRKQIKIFEEQITSLESFRQQSNQQKGNLLKIIMDYKNTKKSPLIEEAKQLQRKYGLISIDEAPQQTQFFNSFYKAELLHNSNKNLEAIAEIDNILSNEPNNIYALQLKGKLLLNDNSYLSAEPVYKRLVQINPNDVESRLQLIQCYNNLNYHQKGLEECENAMKLFPNNYEIRKQKANFLMKTYSYQEAFNLLMDLNDERPSQDLQKNIQKCCDNLPK